MLPTKLIELTKAHGGHKAGERVYATAAEIDKAGLKEGDYLPLGTVPYPRASTLNVKPSKAR